MAADAAAGTTSASVASTIILRMVCPPSVVPPPQRQPHRTVASADNARCPVGTGISRQKCLGLATIGAMSANGSFDVLVIGSGASGLAAAVSAERAGARVALATKGSIQSCNSAKAQGGIQAAFGDDDSPEQHAQDVWRSSHETADMRLVEVLTSEAPVRDPLARGARRRVHARERRLPPRPLRRRVREAAAPGRRPHGPRDHDGAPRRGRGRQRHALPEEPALRARADRARLARPRGRAHARRRDRDPRRRRTLLRRGGGARRALDEPSRRDRRGDAASRSTPARRRATSTRSSTTRTAARGRRRCRATASPRRRARTAPSS